jgi:hypothetical protein
VRRFEFRLEQVLKVKRQYERLAELRQQQARFRLEATQAEVAAVNRQVQELAIAFSKSLRGGGGQQLWTAHYEQSTLLSQFLAGAEERVKQAQQELCEADARRKQIATEVEALLHLRQEQWRAHREDVAHAQQEHLDELGLRRWQAGRRN